MERVASTSAPQTNRIDLSKSPYDLTTFVGRIKHYAWVTDPRLSFTSAKKLEDARVVMEKYRRGELPEGRTDSELRRAQQLYLSAFHPDSGALQNVFGRMSFQVPGGMVLIGAMITFYKTTGAIVFWQWANQSFNALVNYTNSNATTDVSTKRLMTAYASATTSALVVALGLKRILITRASPMFQRFVPFAAVSAANAVNIPLMRQSELTDGVTLMDSDGNEVIKSRYAAIKGITQVVTARIFIAAPSMLILPVFMKRLEATRLLRRYNWMNVISQIFFSGLMLMMTVPVGCAIFPQKCSISSQKLSILDHRRVEELKQSGRMYIPETLFFNKGL